MSDISKNILRLPLLWLLGGILLGASIVVAVRFATYVPETTHYHANFGVYIDGEREQFRGQQYYEEVKVCSLGGVSPQSRTHMHDEENGVVHVHDKAVTWGHFFQNLGWIIGPDFIRTSDELFTADGDKKLNIVLNGQDLTDQTNLANTLIRDEDRLLLSYGDASSETLDEQFESVREDAGEYNSKPDPAACGGSEAPGFKERLEYAL